MSAVKLRIALVLDDSLDRPDGVQQYALTLGRWLEKRGHDVHYVVPDTKRRDIAGLHSIGRSFPVSFNRNTLQFPLPTNKRAIKRLLETYSFDIVHVQLPHNPIFSGRLLRLLPDHTVVIGTFHVAPFGRLERLATRLLAYLYIRQRKLFSSIISVSAIAKPYADVLYKANSEIIPNAVDIKRFSGSKKRRSTTHFEIRFLGRLVERKGCHYLIHAFSKLIDDYPELDVRLTIGGRGKEEQNLRTLVDKLRLANVVTFAGFIAEDDKPQFLADADIMAFPSTGGESFGISLVEAMATPGVVCVAGDNPGYRDVLVPRSVICSPYDSQAFSKLLYKIISTWTYRQKITKQQTDSAVQYDVNVIGNRLLDVYKANLK